MQRLALVSRIISAMGLLLAVLMGFMLQNCSCRHMIFSAIIRSSDATKHSPWTDEVVCPHIQGQGGVRGTVVEIGAGAGISVMCYKAIMGQIEKLILVEPLLNFRRDLEKAVELWGLPLGKVMIVTEGGEDLRQHIANESVDFVVSVHLLCSVEEALKIPVIHEVTRILKPAGGEWRTIDHTTDPDPTSLRYKAQKFIEPVWSIVGNGCQFLDMPRLYEEWFRGEGKGSLKIKSFRHFNFAAVAPWVPLVHPHVCGVMMKVV